MNEDSDFEENNYSRTAEGIYSLGQDSIRTMDWLAYYEILKKKFYDLMGCVFKLLNEIS